MNKKFTFMVAALLAAGGFSANAQVNVDQISKEANGKYYHVVLAANDNKVVANDVVLGSSVNEATGTISYDVVNKKITGDVGSEVFPTFTAGTEKQYIWKVNVTTVSGKTQVTLINAATGYALAVNTDNSNALVSNSQEYSNGSELDKTWELKDNALTYSGTGNTYLDVNSGLVANASAGDKILLVEVATPAVEVSELQNIGTGISVDFDGTIEGEDIFNNVSVVTLTTHNSGKQFLLQVGAAKETSYSAVTDDDFKNAEFIVLTSRLKDAAGVAEEGAGYTYAKVKGSNLVTGTTNNGEVTSGKYPVENALFSAISDINNEGKYAFKQAKVFTTADGKTWAEVTASEAAPIFIGYDDCGKPNGTDYLATSKEAVWATVSGGSAVEVKSLVKGQWIVNILASEDKESTTMKRVVYSSQETTSKVAISSSTDNTNKHKDAVYAQWIVSADENANTVTFKNRETGEVIDGVTLFKTPKANVYTTTSTGSKVVSDADLDSPENYDLNKCFIELRTVENTTQFDGYLNLDKEGLDTEYTLSVDADDKFADYEVPVIAKNIEASGAKSALVKSEDKDAENVFTFKLAQSKDEDSKLDTVFVKVLEYGYYKDGKYVTAKDTLKAITYNFKNLVNAGKNATDQTKDNNIVKSGFYLGYTGESGATEGKFVFRKVGDKYQIVTCPNVTFDYSTSMFIVEQANGSFLQTNGSVESNQSFSLNPVAVAPSYDVPESHIALQINGAYLGSKADGNAIMTNDTSMLKSTVADAAFSFWAFSADKEEAKTPSYYLSSNGMMMYSPANEIAALEKEMAALSPVFDAEERAELKAKIDAYKVNGENLVKFQRAKYEAADKVALADTTYTKDADLKPFKFNVLDVDGQAVLKNAANGYVKAINDVVVFTSDVDDAAKFTVVDAATPTSNEGVSATEVKVVAQDGSVVVKNAAGKNVVVSTILGQVVANEVLTSDNATINVPAGIVVVAVEGESFKVNVR